MQVYTIGYGGRTREEFIRLLHVNNVRTIVDIRLRPDRASMGLWVKAKTPDRGIEKLLADASIGYRHISELGNVFLDCEDWRERYRSLFDRAGDLLTSRLASIDGPLCLLCAEKRVAQCHRLLVADYLARVHAAQVTHLE